MRTKELLQRVERCSDEQLIKNLNELALRDRRNSRAMIVHLVVIKERKIALKMGYKSLFAYCEEKLRMDSGCIATRMQIASKCRDYPLLLEEFVAGKISQTAAARLCPHFSKENSCELIDAARGLSVRELEVYLEKSSRKVIASKASIRRKRSASIAVAGKNEMVGTPLFAASSLSSESESSATSDIKPSNQEAKVPRASDTEDIRFNVKFSASEKFKTKLDRLAEVLGEEKVEWVLEQVIEQAIDDSLEKRDPEKRRARRERRKSARQKKTLSRENHSSKKVTRRRVPSGTYDEVLARSGYRCEFSGLGNKRCDQTARLQVDHIRPWGMGGDHSLENLQVLCQSHNLLKAEKDFGKTRITINRHGGFT